jgi:hypothetical protein
VTISGKALDDLLRVSLTAFASLSNGDVPKTFRPYQAPLHTPAPHLDHGFFQIVGSVGNKHPLLQI